MSYADSGNGLDYVASETVNDVFDVIGSDIKLGIFAIEVFVLSFDIERVIGTVGCVNFNLITLHNIARPPCNVKTKRKDKRKPPPNPLHREKTVERKRKNTTPIGRGCYSSLSTRKGENKKSRPGITQSALNALPSVEV
jgi:hypothetical protein